MKEKLLELKVRALKDIESITNKEEMDRLRQYYLGRKGALTSLLKGLAQLSEEERPVIGKIANQIKTEISVKLQSALESFKIEDAEKESYFDVTLPGRRIPLGHLHPITQTTEEICDIFIKLGFSVVEGPEVELDYYNFEALNIPKDHPARDM